MRINLTYLLGIFIVMFTLMSNGSIVKSSISARSVASCTDESKSYDARSYVQDGLLAQWDGIENVGYGLHDDNPSYWVDLTGSGSDWMLGNAFEVQENCVKILNGVSYNGQGHCTPSWNEGDIKTIEMVIDVSEYETPEKTAQIVSFGTSNGGASTTKIAIYLMNGNNILIGWKLYPMFNISSWINCFFLSPNVQETLVNGYVVSSSMGMYGNNIYNPPILSCYGSGLNPIGVKVHSMRIYNRELSMSERRYNAKIDKARFNIQ